MLVKAASHLRPILRLQGLLTNSHTAASTTTSTSSTASSSATTLFTSSTSSTASQAFTSNATLLTQAQVQAGQAQIATIQQGSGNFIGAAWGLGSAGGAGAGSGAGAGGGTGSKFGGYTGFGRTLTQAQQSTTQQNQDEGDDLEVDRSTLADIRARRPSTLARSKTTTSSTTRRRRSSSRSVNATELPTSASQQIEIDLEGSGLAGSQEITQASTIEDDRARWRMDDESAVEDPDSDLERSIEGGRSQHRLVRRKTTSAGVEVGRGGSWTVGLRGGKFVRLPVRLPGIQGSRGISTTSASSSGSGRTVDDLEMNGPRRDGIKRMRILGSTAAGGVGSVERVRRNSYSASTERSGRSLGDAISAVENDPRRSSAPRPISRSELGLAESEFREQLEARDAELQDRMIQAIKDGNRQTALRLAEEYRNPAALHPDPAVSSAPNVDPPYFSRAGYNLVLDILHRFRHVSEPITNILRTYNEMLERDVLPNIKTYSLVIRALMERNDEIAVATREAESKRKWIVWDRAHAASVRKDGTGGGDYDFGNRHDKLREVEEQIQALKKERNYENAIKLFHSGVTYNRHRPFQLGVYALLLQGAAARGDLQTALQVWGHLEGVNNSNKQLAKNPEDGKTLIVLYAHLVECYSKAKEGGVDGMQDILKRFLADEKRGMIMDGRPLQGDSSAEPELDETSQSRTMSPKKRFDAMRSLTLFFDNLLRGYTVLREDAKAEALLDLMAQTSPQQEMTAGHLISLNSSSVSGIINTLYDRGEWQRSIDILQKHATKIGLRSLIRPYNLLAHRAVQDDNVDAVLQLIGMLKPGRDSMENLLVRRSVVLLVCTLQQPDINPELAEKLVKAVDLVAEVFPNDRPFYVDSTTLRAYMEIAGKLGYYREAYKMMRRLVQHNVDVSSIILSNSGDILRNGGYGAATTLEDKVEYLTTAYRFKQTASRTIGRSLVCELAEALPSDAAKMQAWGNKVGKEAIISIVRVLCRVGGEVNHPLTGDESVQFDQDSETIIRRLAEVRGTSALDNIAQGTLASLLVQRRGLEEARTIFESAFGPTITSSAFDQSSAPSDISAALSDIASPSSIGDASHVSTAPTDVSDASPSIQYSLTPPGVSKMIDQHVGMKPARTPVESYAILKEHADKGQLPMPQVTARLATAMARLGFADKVAELYQYAHAVLATMPEDKRWNAWVVVEDQMLMACCLLGKLEQAGLHRAAILEQNQVPSAEAYALMISSAKDTTDDASVARELWDESQRLGVRPTLFLYNTIISKLSRARKAELALDFFRQMKAQGIRPSSVTYGAVINACCRVGDSESAATLFDEMQSNPNHKPRVPPYNTMMQLHLQSHPSRELVLHYYNQMVQANVAPSAHTYKLLLDAYGTLEPVDLGAMQTVFKNLCNDSRVSVAGTHWASLIHATGNVAGKVQEAIEMFESIPTHPSNKKRGPIEPVCWEALMGVLAQHKMVAELESYRSKMVDQGIKATAYVYNMLIKGYANVGDIEKARAVFESMGDSDMGKAAPNNHPTLLTSSGQLKPSTTADTDVVFREPSTYETMIRAELQAGTKAEARAVCDRMEARMYPIAVTTRIRALVDDSPTQATSAEPASPATQTN